MEEQEKQTDNHFIRARYFYILAFSATSMTTLDTEKLSLEIDAENGMKEARLAGGENAEPDKPKVIVDIGENDMIVTEYPITLEKSEFHMDLYRYDKQMKASPEEIFDVVNDDEKLKQWSPIFRGNDYFTEEERAKGTKFRTKLKVLNKTYNFRSQITDYEENRLVKVRTTLRQGIITSMFQLAPSDNNETQVTVTSNFEGTSRKYNLILKGAKPVIKRVLDSQLNKLEQLAVK